jgi:hypothetical protein
MDGTTAVLLALGGAMMLVGTAAVFLTLGLRYMESDQRAMGFFVGAISLGMGVFVSFWLAAPRVGAGTFNLFIWGSVLAGIVTAVVMLVVRRASE